MWKTTTAKQPAREDTTMATITVEVSDHDLASLRDMATATDPRGSGARRPYSTVEKLAADLLAYLADDWRRMSSGGDRRGGPPTEFSGRTT
jgi:hypothetical protein